MAVFIDGNIGLRAIQHHVAPQAEHVLDRFHIALRFENLRQVAKRIKGLTDGTLRGHARTSLERAKWCFWNGHRERGLIRLVHLRQWVQARCFEQIPSVGKLGPALLDMTRYLEGNMDSMPDYGQRYRAGQRISTGFTESAVNEIIAKRMTNREQMRWNRYISGDDSWRDFVSKAAM